MSAASFSKTVEKERKATLAYIRALQQIANGHLKEGNLKKYHQTMSEVLPRVKSFIDRYPSAAEGPQLNNL